MTTSTICRSPAEHHRRDRPGLGTAPERVRRRSPRCSRRTSVRTPSAPRRRPDSASTANTSRLPRSPHRSGALRESWVSHRSLHAAGRSPHDRGHGSLVSPSVTDHVTRSRLASGAVVPHVDGEFGAVRAAHDPRHDGPVGCAVAAQSLNRAAEPPSSWPTSCRGGAPRNSMARFDRCRVADEFGDDRADAVVLRRPGGHLRRQPAGVGDADARSGTSRRPAPSTVVSLISRHGEASAWNTANSACGATSARRRCGGGLVHE